MSSDANKRGIGIGISRHPVLKESKKFAVLSAPRSHPNSIPLFCPLIVFYSDIVLKRTFLAKIPFLPKSGALDALFCSLHLKILQSRCLYALQNEMLQFFQGVLEMF